MAVNSTTFLADFKSIYGAIYDQVSTQAKFMNLLDKGMGEKMSNVGGRGYTFLTRLTPNWNMGYRPEGVTGVGSAGNQGLAQATVALKYAYVPMSVTGQAEFFSKGNEKAFMEAKALEMKYDTKDMISHVNVIMVGADRGGQLATVESAGSGSIVCSQSSGAPGASYLRVGMPISAAPVGGGTLTVTASAITAIVYSTRTVTHTTGTADAANGVYLGGEIPADSADFPYTAEGLVSLVSSSGARQGLNPATSGQESWQSLATDVGGLDLSSQLMDEQIQLTLSRSGEDPDIGIFGMAQANRLTAIATTTIRFNTPSDAVGKKALDLGYTAYAYGGRTIVVDKDARADRTFWGKRDKLALFDALPLGMADDEAGEWTRIIGASGIADATAGLMRWYHQLGIYQRNAWSVYYGYSVPAGFQNVAPTF